MNNVDKEALNYLFENNTAFNVQESKDYYLLNPLQPEKKYDWAALCITENNVLSESDLVQLNKILNYLKKDILDAAIFIGNKNTIAPFYELQKLSGFNKLMVYGGNRTMLQLNIEITSGYELIYLKYSQLFFAHSLTTLLQDDAKRKQLKPLFDKLLES